MTGFATVRCLPLKEAVTKLVDGSHNPPPKRDAGKPMLSARNIENGRIVFDEFRLIDEAAFVQEHARSRVAPNDVLLTIVGTIGRTAVVPQGTPAFALQRSVAVLTPREELDPQYLCYQLQSPSTQRYFEENARGTAQKGVYLKTLGATPVLVPPLDEQRRIVAEIDKQFSRLDEAVANLQRVKANLKRYKAAVLKAAVEGRFTAGSSDSFRRVRLGDLVELNPRLPKGSLDENFSVTFVPMAAVGADDGRLGVTATRSYSEVRKGYTYFADDDVLFAKVTPCMENGKIAVAKGLLGGVGFGSTEFHVLRPKRDIDPRYVYCIVSSESFRKEAARHMTGAVGLRRVPSAFLESVEVSVPPLDEQLSVVSEVERHLTIIQGVDAEVEVNLQRSNALRQSVLRTAFSGGRHEH